MPTALELNGLANIVNEALRNPDGLRLALAGCESWDEMERATQAWVKALRDQAEDA